MTMKNETPCKWGHNWDLSTPICQSCGWHLAEITNYKIGKFKNLAKLADDQGKSMMAESYRRIVARLGSELGTS